MSDRTFTVRPSYDEDSSFEDIDRPSVNGHDESDEPGKEKDIDIAGAAELATEAVAAALEEDTKDKQREEKSRLLGEISRHCELKSEEMEKAKKAMDQLLQFNGLLMKENEDLQAKLRTHKEDEDFVNKAEGVTDSHRARFNEFVKKMVWRDSSLTGKLAVNFVLTILHAIVSLAFFCGKIRFNAPAIIISILLTLVPFDSYRTTALRCAILIMDVLWICTPIAFYHFILMVVKTLFAILSAWSICDETITGNTELRERLLSACCPAKFAGAEALRDGTPRTVEINKVAGSLGIIISKPADSPVFVAHIIPDGAAEKEGGLRTGDEILKVNGKAVDGMTKEEVVYMLAWIDGTVALEVRNNKVLVANEI